MNMDIRYKVFIIFATFFYSCSTDFNSIVKDNSSIIFYNQDSKYKQIDIDEAGHILSIQVFKNNKLDMKWVSNISNLSDTVEFYGNGQIKVKGYLKDGKKHSLWTYFDRDGHLLIERYFSYGKPSNIWIWYDHHTHDIQHYEVYPDNRDDGLFTRYYQSSNIKEQKRYAYNKLDGQYQLFYDNPSNSIQLMGQYFSGFKMGNWEMFNPAGTFQQFFE